MLTALAILFSNTPSGAAENPPTPEQLATIRAHEGANKEAIEAADTKFRAQQVERALRNLAETGSRERVVTLREIGLPFSEGFPIFSRLLTHQNAEVVAEAIFSLGELYGPQAAAAMDSLIAAYRRDNDLIAFEAARTFTKIGTDASAAVGPMTEKLQANEGSERMRVMTIQALGTLGPASMDAVPVLKQQLAADDLRRSYEAFLAIGRITHPEAIAAEKLPTKEAYQVSIVDAFPVLMAIRQGRVARDAAMKVLHAFLASDTHSLSARIMAVETLGLAGPTDPASLSLLVKLVGSSDLTMSQVAAKAAMGFTPSDPSAVGVATAALESPDDRVGLVAANVLLAFGPEATAAVPQAIRALHALKPTTDIRRVGAILDLIRSVGTPAKTAQPFLNALLKENHALYEGRSTEFAAEIRAFALLTLARIGITEEAVPAIVDILANSNHPKEFAIASIAAASLPQGRQRTLLVRFLQRALVKEYPDTLVSLERFGVMPDLESAASNTSARVEAIKALAAIDGPEARKAVPLLKERSEDPWQILGLTRSYQQEAMKALALLSK